jgi:anthranilate 1,2-dioxygenase small subunit
MSPGGLTADEVARRLELADLLTDYADCLDSDALERWPEFFTEDCAYRITSAENYDSGLPLGIVYATSKNMLKDRVMALREANIYEPQRYRHLISGLKIVADRGAALDLVANFLVIRIMQDGDTMIFAVGRYVDTVVRQEGGWKFARRTVILDSRRIDTLLAIPI